MRDSTAHHPRRPAPALRRGASTRSTFHLVKPRFPWSLLAEVIGFEDPPNLQLDVAVFARPALHPFDRLLLRSHLNHREAGDELLGFGERAVDDRPLAAGRLHPHAPRARVQAFPVEKD